MKLSESGFSLLKELEGFSATRYFCSADKLTIGHGHVILPGDSFDEPMSRAEAHNLLISDLRKFEGAVNRLVKVPLSQEQYDALVLLTFNIGDRAFAESTLLERLNEGKYHDAAAQFDRWVYAGKKKVKGLKNRRAREKELFLSGTARPPLKPLAKSREIAGSTMAAVGTAGDVIFTEARDAIEPIADYSDALRWVFVALVLAGIALTIYGRVSNRKRGLV